MLHSLALHGVAPIIVILHQACISIQTSCMPLLLWKGIFNSKAKFSLHNVSFALLIMVNIFRFITICLKASTFFNNEF